VFIFVGAKVRKYFELPNLFYKIGASSPHSIHMVAFSLNR